MKRIGLFLLTMFAATAILLAPSHGQDKRPGSEPKPQPAREPDVIYVPTPNEVVEKMFELADIRSGEIVYDLGCGDARIPVMASKKFGVKSWGFDIDPRRIEDSLANVSKNKVEHLVTIKQQDIFDLDISKADVITLYLLPRLNVKLIPQLDKLKPGCRIVSHDFNMEGVRPKREVTVRPAGGDSSRDHRVYLWVTPLEKERPN